MTNALPPLLAEIAACRHCEARLPHGAKPIVQAGTQARLLIISQAPGRRAHDTGIPWNDPSGDRLRGWLGLSRERFYDPSFLAIMPSGFCYPGKGKSGDLPPRPECAPLWHDRLLAALPAVRLTLLIGRHAQQRYLGHHAKPTLTATVAAWRDYLPAYLPLPHPSPRNQGWWKNNPWFAADVLPALQAEIASLSDA